MSLRLSKQEALVAPLTADVFAVKSWELNLAEQVRFAGSDLRVVATQPNCQGKFDLASAA